MNPVTATDPTIDNGEEVQTLATVTTLNGIEVDFAEEYDYSKPTSMRRM